MRIWYRSDPFALPSSRSGNKPCIRDRKGDREAPESVPTKRKRDKKERRGIKTKTKTFSLTLERDYHVVRDNRPHSNCQLPIANADTESKVLERSLGVRRILQ